MTRSFTDTIEFLRNNCLYTYIDYCSLLTCCEYCEFNFMKILKNNCRLLDIFMYVVVNIGVGNNNVNSIGCYFI